MSIRTDPVANFYDAVRGLSFKQTNEVAMEIAAMFGSDVDSVRIKYSDLAKALSDAAEDKPTNVRPTRGATDGVE